MHYGSVGSGDEFDVNFLQGRGTIDATRVVCESPAWAVQCHTGYPPRSVDRDDVRRLCAKFGLPLPVTFR